MMKIDPYDWFCGPGSHMVLNEHCIHVHCHSKINVCENGVSIFLMSLKKVSPRFTKAVIIWSKYSKNSNILKYYYNLKCLFSIFIYFKM